MNVIVVNLHALAAVEEVETGAATVEAETVVATVEVETVAEEEISETEVVTEVVTEVEVSVNSVNDQVAKIENPALNAKKIPVVVVETIHKKRALIILEIECQITHSSPVIMTIEVSK